MPLKWPFTYEGENTAKISFPLGGIGTGSVGLSGGGRLIDWEIFNKPEKGSTNGFSHFAVKAERNGRVIDARILNGPYHGDRTGDFQAEATRNFGTGARRDSLVGMPHFKSCRFHGRFPTARLTFDDDRFPGAVELEAFNPFIPLDSRNSSMPVAMFEVSLRNTSDEPTDYTVVGVLGHGPFRPTQAKAISTAAMRGVEIVSQADDPDAEDYSELVIATDADDASVQTYLYHGLWFDSLQVYWEDLLRPGRFADRTSLPHYSSGGMRRDRDHSLQAAHLTLAPGERRTIRFIIAWYVPNFHKYWISPVWHFEKSPAHSGAWKNWYATEWQGASEIAEEALRNWDRLRSETLLFRDALYGSTLPLPVLDAAAANLSILKSATVVRLQDGTFYGWEGLYQDVGSCEGSCTHVWNYQQALPFLFPSLERTMRETDYAYNLNEAGGMSFRLALPLGAGGSTERPCADGQFGNVMKAYRDWKLSGDDEFLGRLWPSVKQSVEYAWSPENPDRWDPSRTGVLWGRQHHTLDMELFGPNSWLTSFYLGALKAGAEMAEHMGEAETAREWREIFERGRTWVDKNLFNGEYYIQSIALDDRRELDPYAKATVSRRIVGANIYDLYWSDEHKEIKYQIGEGCIVDQVLGQWHADLYGLGQLLEPAHVRSALKAIYRYNFKRRLEDVANPCRVFGVYDEAGVVICSWRKGSRAPAVPVPYAQETMHGFEYAFGSALMAYGLLDQGVEIFRGVRDRYDGKARNPWNEIECGSNYARSMASWAGLLTLSGYSFDARRHEIGFSPKVREGLGFRSFWSNATSWGMAEFTGGTFTLSILYGETDVARIGLPIEGGSARVLVNDQAVESKVEGNVVSVEPVRLRRGDTLRISADQLSVNGLREASTL
ncbi:GH116 family glycosyl-hydrolase [Microvirga massiliensis]|uniref:GH116 family glycosyl-hydrolase n=1 Tax=Microvirga massiliensis TaxID=1033741 RepID=UPI00062BB0F9|nr:GH116 family glycosyl-hydrolase [Microvirga massiliensis]